MNELATMLSESVTRLFEDLAGREVLEAAEEGTWPAELWKALEETAVTQALVSEDAGGVGASWSDVEVVLRAAGRHAAPVPLAETMVAAWLCSQTGLEVPDGILTLAPTAGVEVRNGQATGSLGRVPWGARASVVATEALVDGTASLVLLEVAQAEVTAGEILAREPRDDLSFRAASLLASAPFRGGLSAGAVEQYGALARASQMTGALEHLLAESVRFANDRVQFGRPIGKFQAIQHQLAVLASETAAAGAALAAACSAAESDDSAFHVAVAKSRAGEAAGIGAKIAHASHGAIGFTYEHALHFATRRLWSWRTEFGAEAVWNDRLGQQAMDRGADSLWSDLTAR